MNVEPVGNHERRHIFTGFGVGSHKGHLADPAELNGSAESFENGKVLNNDIARELRAVGNDDAVADFAGVGNVAIRH